MYALTPERSEGPWHFFAEVEVGLRERRGENCSYYLLPAHQGFQVTWSHFWRQPLQTLSGMRTLPTQATGIMDLAQGSHFNLGSLTDVL